MKLSNEELNFIQLVIKTADLIDISNIIIEPGKVRAMDEEQTVVLFQDKNIPLLSFGSIGINRTGVFTSRLELARAQENFEVKAVTAGDDPSFGFDKYDPSVKNGTTPMWVRSLTMSGRGTKIDYRCASPQTIRAPKNRAGVTQYTIALTPEAVTMIQKGKSAMKADEVTFNGNSNGVSLELSDINGDTLEYHFADVIQGVTPGHEPDFSYKYPIDMLLPIFKTNPMGVFSLTARGSMMFTVNGLDVYIMAKG